jgi:uncharacterized protein YndB with AHSA1/START domain
MTDRIERTVELRASIERVWRAITDHREFGEWFEVDLDGPFAAGEVSTGRITTKGYEGAPWRVQVTSMDEPNVLAFTWHPYDVDPGVDLSDEQTTLVEFRLEANGTGTRLTITESGFDGLADPRRLEAFRSNNEGWSIQTDNIRRYVDG